MNSAYKLNRQGDNIQPFIGVYAQTQVVYIRYVQLYVSHTLIKQFIKTTESLRNN